MPQDPAPFDAAAADYDARFTHTSLGRLLRAAVHRHLADVVRPGDRVLELGCGTGEDALWMAARGAHVVATDASEAMLAIGERKAARAGLQGRIEFVRLDLSRAIEAPLTSAGAWPRSAEGSRGGSLGTGTEQFDAVVADFGVLNCLPDRTPVATKLAEWVCPGGTAALVFISPVCAWEIVWHLAHGRVRDAFRRFRSGETAHVGGGSSVRVWYPSASRVRGELAPRFRHRRTAGVGALLPPSYLAHLVDRLPKFFGGVAVWDGRLGPLWPFNRLSDHYVMLLERR